MISQANPLKISQECTAHGPSFVRLRYIVLLTHQITGCSLYNSIIVTQSACCPPPTPTVVCCRSIHARGHVTFGHPQTALQCCVLTSRLEMNVDNMPCNHVSLGFLHILEGVFYLTSLNFCRHHAYGQRASYTHLSYHLSSTQNFFTGLNCHKLCF